MRHVAWLLFVFVAVFGPGCSQGDPSASRPVPAERVAATRQALTTLDTTPGNATSGPFGQPTTQTFGQTITAPLTDTVLNSFSIVMASVPATVVFRGEVYAWNGTRVTGAALYESGPTSTAAALPETVTFNTGGITLTPGAQYVLFATAAKDVGVGQGAWSTRSDNPYAGGTFVTTDSAPAQWSTIDWVSLGAVDVAFKASFTAPPASSTTLASSANPSVFGQSVTLTATVTGAGATPTGTVTFKDGVTTLGTGALDGVGKTSLATAALTVGAHSITAVYGGSGSYGPSTSVALVQTVNKASTSTALSSSGTPSIVSGNVTFTATVSLVAPGAGTPTGTASFREGAAVLGTGAVNGAGIATFSTSALTVGSHTIVVDYGGDASFATSTSPAVVQFVNQDGATVGLASTLNPSTFGASTTFTATVASVGSGGTPTGSVTFKDGGTTLGTNALNAAGQATLAIATLAGGSHTIVAEYSGDPKHSIASGSLTQTVNVGASASAIASLTNPSVFGQSVTFRATVTGAGATPTGTVTFSDGAATIGTGTLNGAGQVTVSTTLLSAGSHAITATYGGDTNFGISSAAVTQQVNKAATATVLLSSSQPTIVGSPVTFTATVSAVLPGAGIPTGTVTFRDGAIIIGTGALNASGVATLTTAALAVGNHTITATYGADASFLGSTSANLTQTVNQDGVSVTLLSSLNPSTFGAMVTFTATVISSGAAGTPTGTVTFRDGAALLGTSALSAAGTTTYATAALAGGSHSISATYNGDAKHAAGSTASVGQIVKGADTTTALTSSVNPSVFGQSTTLTATVTSAAPGARTGTVTFFDGVTTLATVVIDVAGVAAYSTSAFTVATHPLSAVYGGDTNYLTSTSAGVDQVVDLGSTTTAIGSSSNPSLIDSTVTFTATVTAKAPSAGTPTGTVTFKDGATVLGTGTLAGGGVATFATATLTVGPHTITAEYGGSASHDVSVSPPLAQNVSSAAAAIALKSSPRPSSFGDVVTLTAVLTGAVGTPTGTIVFKDGLNVLGQGTLTASASAAVATLTVTSLPVGTHLLSDTYSGDTIYATATGTVSHVVNKATTTTTLVAAPNPSTFGAGATFTATVGAAVDGFTGTIGHLVWRRSQIVLTPNGLWRRAIRIDSFSGMVADLKIGQRTSEDILAVLAKHPRVSAWDMSEILWLRIALLNLEKRGLIASQDEPYPWCRFVLTDAGLSALPPNRQK